MALTPLVVDTVFEITYKGRHLRTGCEVINRQHFRVVSGPTPKVSTIKDFTDECAALWGLYVLPVLSDDYFLEQTIGKVVTEVVATTPPSRPGTVTTYGDMYVNLGTGTGGVASPSLPAFVTVSVKLQTTNPTRGARGGIHFGLVAVSQQATVGKDLFSGTALATWTAAMGDYVDTVVAVGSSNAEMVVLSKVWLAYVSAATPPIPVVLGTNDVETTIVNPWLRSQLSRLAPNVP